jgi:5'-nucleotidase
MAAADAVFRADGEIAYRRYQINNLDVPFSPGIAFPFIKRLLNLNLLYPEERPIEVIVLSRNDPDSGRRFFRSCNSHGLEISRGAFLTGKSPHRYAKSFNASLLLSANISDVKEAIKNGVPAGLVLGSAIKDEEEDVELRIAFDFDGVIIDDESEKIFRNSGDVKTFHDYELKNIDIPHKSGPLSDLFRKIAMFQRLEREKIRSNPGYRLPIRVSIVTARDAPANERVITTLNHWQVEVDEVFFMGGIEKGRVLEVLNPHIFFDDQISHLKTTSAIIPSVHIPFGIANSEEAEIEKVAGNAKKQPKQIKAVIKKVAKQESVAPKERPSYAVEPIVD